jgi:hypothetical protein
VKALCWEGVNQVGVTQVPDPELRNEQDAIVKVRRSVTCGSDLHLLGGYIPFMRKGDVLGHEFIGEIVETGRSVTGHHVGDRVVVSSFVSCGRCWYCRHQLYSCCRRRPPDHPAHLDEVVSLVAEVVDESQSSGSRLGCVDWQICQSDGPEPPANPVWVSRAHPSGGEPQGVPSAAWKEPPWPSQRPPLPMRTFSSRWSTS